MQQKLPKQANVQLLVNAIMPWAEAELQKEGKFCAGAAWLLQGAAEPVFRSFEEDEPASELSIQQQEATLTAELQGPWQRGEFAAVILVAPVLYGRKGSTERTEAVRLHVEAHRETRGEAAAGYCADILMPYRIRAAGRWRSGPRNRVHFSHPVAQESDSRFSGSPAPAPA